MCYPIYPCAYAPQIVGCSETFYKYLSNYILIDRLSSLENVDCGSAYFFFDGRSGETDLALHHRMLRSLIFQLSHQTRNLPEALLLAYKATVNSLEITLQSIIQEFEHVYLVVDALDECGDKGCAVSNCSPSTSPDVNANTMIFRLSHNVRSEARLAASR